MQNSTTRLYKVVSTLGDKLQVTVAMFALRSMADKYCEMLSGWDLQVIEVERDVTDWHNFFYNN